ncbi:unnamed protein product [Effrenium voratum]|nr:unnamed protein product [Effrenium voratum]
MVLCDLNAAAGTWLQRLRRDDLLPEKGLLETLRRREVNFRQHAQELAEAEHGRAELATDCLARERHLHQQRHELLEDAQAALRAEQLRRAEAEALVATERKARHALEEACAVERRRRLAAEAREAQAERKVKELMTQLEDDEGYFID